MSEDMKFVVRPKVRFGKTDVRETEDLKGSMQKKITAQTDRPKIRSIEIFKKPVRIVNVSKTSDSVENKEFGDTNKEMQSLVEPTCLCNNTTKDDIQKPLNDADNIGNVKKNTDDKDVLKHFNIVLNDNTENAIPLLIPIADDETVDEIVGLQNNVETRGLKVCMKNKKGKENKLSVKKNLKSLENKNKFTCSKTTLRQENKFHVAKPNVSGKIPIDTTDRSLKLVPTITNIMPCLKYKKVAANVKTSTVVKTVIRDIEGHRTKAIVGPGFPSRRHNDNNAPNEKENICVGSNISGEKLKRPEYNSIMCTLNKLRQVKEQKIVTDIDHLPTAHRNLVHGKISAALDFPLDEAIYKNLVDLSIDEQQLPGKLMRAKDPELKQRDIVPVLSDFFKPVSMEEYRTTVSVKSRIPEVVDNWDAFRISDKILQWKQSMEHA